MFLITVGLVALAVRSGALPADTHWFDLWPVVLIAAGIGLLLNITPLAPLGGVLVALSLGVLVGGTLQSGLNVAAGCGTRGSAFPTASGSLGATATVSIEIGCGSTTVSGVAGSGWSISGTTSDGRPPSISGGSDALTVRNGQQGGFFGFDRGGTLAIQLPLDPTLDLSTTLNAGSDRLNLTGMHLAAVSLTVNAGDETLDLDGTSPQTFDATVNAGTLKVTLPRASLSGGLTVNAGSVRMCVPAGVGVRIETSGGVLGGYDFGRAGLLQSGSVWQSPGFDSAQNRIQLSATANAGSITLNPAEGCA